MIVNTKVARWQHFYYIFKNFEFWDRGERNDIMMMMKNGVGGAKGGLVLQIHGSVYLVGVTKEARPTFWIKAYNGPATIQCECELVPKPNLTSSLTPWDTTDACVDRTPKLNTKIAFSWSPTSCRLSHNVLTCGAIKSLTLLTTYLKAW